MRHDINDHERQIHMSFRENLLHLRALHNMTQEQLAEQLGVSRQSVTKWESDKSYPEMDKLIGMCQIFDCTLDELVQGDLTGRTAEPDETDEADEVEVTEQVKAAATEEQPATPVDECGFDQHIRHFAERISTGVMMIILGSALSIVFYSLGESSEAVPPLAGNIAAALGLCCTLGGVVLGIALIIPAGLEHAAFVRTHPHIEDFYTENQRAKIKNAFVYELVGGIVLIFIGILVMVLLSDTAIEEVVGVPIMLALIAIGVKSIIHGSMVFGLSNVASYNEGAAAVLEAHEIGHMNISPEQKAELLEQHTADKRTGGLCGAIMIVATIAGLVMLFVPGYQTPLFWLAWPIGGLLCGLVATLMKAFTRA